MKAVVAAFNQKKALVGAFSVITNLRMERFEALVAHQHQPHLSLAQRVHLAENALKRLGYYHGPASPSSVRLCYPHTTSIVKLELLYKCHLWCTFIIYK